eukprot:COSAG03_NODE_12960_length_523_cov_1.094340_1_plen_157_part_10
MSTFAFPAIFVSVDMETKDDFYGVYIAYVWCCVMAFTLFALATLAATFASDMLNIVVVTRADLAWLSTQGTNIIDMPQNLIVVGIISMLGALSCGIFLVLEGHALAFAVVASMVILVVAAVRWHITQSHRCFLQGSQSFARQHPKNHFDPTQDKGA